MHGAIEPTGASSELQLSELSTFQQESQGAIDCAEGYARLKEAYPLVDLGCGRMIIGALDDLQHRPPLGRPPLLSTRQWTLPS